MKVVLNFATFIFLTVSSYAQSACETYYRFHGNLDLKTKSFTLVSINSDEEDFCEELPLPLNPNIEITVTKDDKKFNTKIFRSFYQFWDHPEPNGKWTGGAIPKTELYIETFIPSWYKGSLLKIRDLNNDKVMTEVKL